MKPVQPVRRTLVDHACEQIREGIIRRHLAAGDRVTETDLATKLGISRTPLRAAIARLSSEGLVKVETGRGIRIAHANTDLVREMYPILAVLDGLAVQMSVDAKEVDVDRLRHLNRQIKRGVPRARLFKLDREFHHVLREGCPNRRVLELIERHLHLASHCDGATARGMHAIGSSRAEHDAIIAAVAKRDANRARALVEAHWHGGIAVVVEWIELANASSKGARHAS